MANGEVSLAKKISDKHARHAGTRHVGHVRHARHAKYAGMHTALVLHQVLYDVYDQFMVQVMKIYWLAQ